MNKWFESKNLANYAKTALLQAQKRIDQVLDIKEDEILGQSGSSTSTLNAASLTSASLSSFNAQKTSTAGNFDVSSTDKVKLTSNSVSSLNLSGHKRIDDDTDSFFSTFLTANNQLTSNGSSSTLKDLSTNREPAKTPPIPVVNVESKPNSDDAADESNTSVSSSTATIEEKFNTKVVKPNNGANKSTTNKSTLELEKLEKQTWIQNYVDSSVDKTTPSSLVNQTASNFSEGLKSDAREKKREEENSSSSVVGNNYETMKQLVNEGTNSASNITSMTDIDYIKVDSNGSISGNASSTEEGLETCASSDIEVLSLPSNNGDQLIALHHHLKSSMNRVPSLASMAASIRTTGKIGSSSNDAKTSGVSSREHQSSLGVHQNQSSSSNTKTVMQIYVKSPPPPSLGRSGSPMSGNVNSPQIISNPSTSQTNNQTNQSTTTANPTSTASNPTTTTSSGPANSANVELTDEQANQSSSLKALLDAREAHVLKLNKQNVKLQEDNDNLMNEMEKLKYDLNEKFKINQRQLSELQAKYDQTLTDRDTLRRVNADLQRESNEIKQMLNEKEAQVEQLTQEGIKLSKQELNQSNIIKKLRAKEKETEEIMNILKTDYQKSQKELEELKSILDAKEDAETKNTELFKKLEKTAVTLEKELINTKSLLEDSEEKVKSLENTLQNSYRELAELRKSNVEKESQINLKTSTIESQLKEEIKEAVEKERILAGKKQEALKWELESVRQDISRIEQQHALREDMLRKEISDLQQQLRDSETRNNELSQNISSATKPLLRQIENLQATHSSQIELLETAERNLIERLKETQANLCAANEKYRQNQESLIDLSQQVKTYEIQLQTLKLEKSKLSAEYQLTKTTLDTYENEKLEKDAENRAIVTSLSQQIETLTREKKYLESQLEIEKTKVENDSKKFQALISEYTREKELLLKQQQTQPQLQQQQQQSSPSTPLTTSMHESSSPSLTRFATFFESKNELIKQTSDLFGHTPTALNTLEMLQSKLKQKEGEIIQLQKEVQNLEKVRDSMGREMVNLSNKLNDLEDQIKEYPELKDKYDKLVIQYNALLTMYGEKTEENEELRMDLQDVKEMYKVQIEDLLKRTSS